VQEAPHLRGFFVLGKGGMNYFTQFKSLRLNFFAALRAEAGIYAKAHKEQRRVKLS
jgi:hypothetical protein